MANTPLYPNGMGVVILVVSQGPLPWGLVWTHMSHTYSQVAQPPLPRSIICLVQLGRFPGQMFVSHKWEDCQVRCLSRATGRGGHMTIRLWTTHIMSSHTASRSLGHMSVSCSWVAQTPSTHIHTYQAHNNCKGGAMFQVTSSNGARHQHPQTHRCEIL